MNKLETLNIAIKALSVNKARTLLTMLGVIIGVFAVVSLTSLVKGVQNYVTDEFEKLGSNLLFVSPGRSAINRDPALSYTDNKLRESHLDLIDQYAGDLVKSTTPWVTVGKTVEYKSKNYFGVLVGGNEKFADILNIRTSEGSLFTQNDVRTGAKVVVLGSEVKKTLFGSKKATGEIIRVDGKSMKVIGVAEEKGSDWDIQIYAPYTMLDRTFDADDIANIMVKLNDDRDVELATKNVELALLRNLKKDEFSVMSQKEILDEVKNILGILQLGLGAVAGISLIVGGIGIMNIMLVSVTERTREVGLRKALGATSRDIGTQFLAESVLISATGGFIGLILGYTATFLVQSIIRAEVPWWAVLLALGFSSIVGVAFGTYPAILASKKDPIVSLRYE